MNCQDFLANKIDALEQQRAQLRDEQERVECEEAQLAIEEKELTAQLAALRGVWVELYGTKYD